MRAKIEAASANDLSVHIADKSNPHGVTAEQIGAAKAEDLKSYLPLTGGAMTGAIINKNTSQGIVWSSDALELKALDTSKKTSATARIHENGVFGVELKNSADDFGGHFRVLHGNGYDGVYYNSDAARFDDDHRLAQQSYVDNAVKYRTNPNLLDNWFFGNPVNQRGQTEYTGGLGIDRWRLLNVNKMSVQSDCVIFTFVDNNYVAWERLENLVSGTYTLSLLFKDGTLVTNTKAIDVSQTSYVIDTPRHNEWNVQLHEDKTVRITCIGNSGDTAAILAAKLELGSSQTLAHKDPSGNWILNEIPDFGEQLRRCTYYAEKVESADTPAITNSTFVPSGATSAVFILPYARKRTAPAINFNDISNYRIIARSISGGTTAFSATAISLLDVSRTKAAILVSFNATDQGYYCFLQRSDNAPAGYAFISADL